MNKWNNDDGFTLLEMLIVMIIITILILLIVPNIAKQSEGIHSSGCEALVKTVQTQVQAYQLEEKNYPLIEQLHEDIYNACDEAQKLMGE